MDNRQQRDRLAELLRRAYWATHAEPEMLGVPDHHQVTILQHLRLRIIPSEQIADNFEAHLQHSSTAFGTPQRHYLSDLRRFRKLRRRERNMLHRQMMEAEGYIYRHGGWESAVEGMGEIEAFVFDSVTGQYLVRSGIGVHHLAVIALYDQIRPAELGKRWPLTPVERRRDLIVRMEYMIAGFILYLPGWSTPFLHLWAKEPNVPLEQWRENARRVQQLKLFLVAEHDGQPVPPSSTR